MSDDTLQQVSRARMKMLLTQPFYGLLAMQMESVAAPWLVPPTAGTDGERLYWHPDSVTRWTLDELVGVMAHEVEHAARGHAWRRDFRDRVLWNLAGDLVINWDLKQAGFQLPTGVLLEEKYAGMTAERVYDLIRDDPKYTKLAKQMQTWCVGEIVDAPEGQAAGEQAVKWQGRMASAANAARAQGKVPAHIEAELERLRKPPIDLPTILQRFLVVDRNYEDYDWAYPHRGYLASGLYMPSLRGEVMPPVGIFVDTSGSVSSAELEYFGGVLADVLTVAKPRRTYVVYCDAGIPTDGVQEYVPGEEMVFRPVGRGGTDFRPPFEHARQQGWPLACAIYLTDLDGPFPDREPEYPVLWVQTGAKGRRAPWGETFDLEVPGA